MAGTSIGCSSPNSHSLVDPVRSPACPASRRSWSPLRMPFSRPANTWRSAVSPSRRTAFGVSSSLPPSLRQVALPLQLALEPAQCLQVVHRLPAERAADRFLVDVLKAGARVLLAERGLQVGEVRQVGDRAGRVAEAERLAAGHPDPALRLAELGPAGAQRVAERGQLRRQAGVLHGLGHQVRQFLALLVRQRVEQPLGRHHPPRRASRRAPPGSPGCRGTCRRTGHEVVEVLLRVLAARVGVEHLPQVREHVLDPLHGRGVRVLQRLLHALELAVEHLPAQQVAQLLELLPCLRRPPVVVGELADGLRGVVRQRVEFGLAQPWRRRSGRGTARRARLRAPRRAARGPGRASRRAGPALRSSRCRSRTRRIRSSRPRRSCQPRRSRSRSASRGLSPPRMRSPISSSASRTS